MADNKSSGTSWFKELKAEFKKITWPSRERITKHTVAVTVTSIILGVVITLVDILVRNGFQLLIR